MPRIAELPAPEVAARIGAGAVVLLPMGSTETHGPGAPMGDYLLAEQIALLAAGRADALVAPALPFGGEDFFAGVPGGVALTHGTLSALLREVVGGLIAGGARRVLIINGHGGNIPPIEETQRRMREAHDLLIPALHLWREATALLPGLGADPAATGHGGNPVLSVALHLLPQLCRPERLAPRAAGGTLLGQAVSGFGGVKLGGVTIGLPTLIDEIAPGGTQATDPRSASAALGARITDALVDAACAAITALKEHGG